MGFGSNTYCMQVVYRANISGKTDYHFGISELFDIIMLRGEAFWKKDTVLPA